MATESIAKKKKSTAVTFLRRPPIVSVVISMLIIAVSCQRATEVHTSADLDLVNRVRNAFAADHDKQGATRGVEIHVKDGVVTLTGKVDTDSDKRLAEQLARNVAGVRSVVNQIEVLVTQSSEASWNERKIREEAGKSGEKIGPDTEDARIYEAVRRLLIAHEGTYKREIFVDVVNRDVTLRGRFIGTTTARDEAVAAARSIPEVKAVIDQLMVSATGTSSP